MATILHFWYLFNFTTKKIDNTNVTLGHLLFKAISKRPNKEKIRFDCFNRSCIWDSDNKWHQDYYKT